MRRSLVSFLSKQPKDRLFQLGIGAGLVIALLVMAVLGPYFFDPYSLVTAPFQPPSAQHPAGTDVLGRDILSRLIIGTRQTLTVAGIAVLIATTAGTILGILVGYLGGNADRLASVIMDGWYSLPDLVVALLISVVLGPGAVNAGLAIGLALIPQFFRVMRSDALSVKSATYIEAERIMGANTLWILFRHLLPAALPSLFVMVTIGLARSVLTIGGLGFLGLGVPPPTPEWGSDMGAAKSAILSGVWWPTTFAGFMIFIAVLGFNQLGSGLNSLINSRRTS
ncbi:MAG: ABC transporter permease [Thaumarchaeota archaeon]|nr:ABC transporter permease [Nitrososphaerota archaeon]